MSRRAVHMAQQQKAKVMCQQSKARAVWVTSGTHLAASTSAGTSLGVFSRQTIFAGVGRRCTAVNGWLVLTNSADIIDAGKFVYVFVQLGWLARRLSLCLLGCLLTRYS